MCECIVHLYSVFHVTPDGRIWSHSQNSCNALSDYERRTGIVAADVPTTEYKHNMMHSEGMAMYAKYAVSHAAYTQIITCCDDLCVGGGHCIHGDGEATCPQCGGEGDLSDDDDDGGYSAYLDDIESLDAAIATDKARVESMRARLAGEPYDSLVWARIAEIMDAA